MDAAVHATTPPAARTASQHWPRAFCVTIRAASWLMRASISPTYARASDRCLERLVESSSARLGSFDARLHSLSPLAVLDRGYALVLSMRRHAHSFRQRKSAAGEQLTTRLADGSFSSRVETVTPGASGNSKPGKQGKRSTK